MPEGDTILRSARTLHAALSGRPVTRFETVLPALQRVHDDHAIVGRVVESVRAMGKHLLMAFSGGLVLRTHMRMNGSWHIYRPDERWQRSRVAMRVVVGNDEYVAVAFDVPVAEFLTTAGVARHRTLSSLGSDLLSADFSASDAVARLATASDIDVADALLDQRVMAGVGNVFKSEVLFVCRIHPFRRAETLTDGERVELVERSRDLLRANVVDSTHPDAAARGGARRTTGMMDPRARLWVYGRNGRPCRICGAPVQARKRGPDSRLTYWCPRCQPPEGKIST
jgi:endonuclease VIII